MGNFLPPQVAGKDVQHLHKLAEDQNAPAFPDQFRHQIQKKIQLGAASHRPGGFELQQAGMTAHLAEFQQRRPELDVRIVTSQQAFDIRGEAVDLAISFGDGQWPGCDAQQILPEEVVPVCSPAMLERHMAAGGTAAQVMALPLLHLGSSGQEPWMTWQEWAQLQGLPGDGELQSLTLGNYPLLIQAAVAGHGVALGWRPLVDALLRDGQLVSLPVPSLTTRRGYFLVQPRGREAWEALDSFREWIVAGCEELK